MDNRHEQTDAVSSGTAPSSSLAWLRGFVEAVRTPERMDALRYANVWKIYIAGALLLAISYTVAAGIVWNTAALHAQMVAFMNLFPGTKGAMGSMDVAFPWPAALGSTLVQTGLIGLGVQACMMWLIQRVIMREPLRLLAVLGITSFAASITAIGYLLTVLVQVTTGSMAGGFSLAPLFTMQDHPYLFTYLQKIDLFWLWQYVVIGLSTAAFCNRKRGWGLLIALIGIVIHASFSGSLAYIGYQQAMSMAK
ncbi:MAG: hypothetical protein ACKOBV_04790 [Candidatus Kapaibacterium sp.]